MLRRATATALLAALVVLAGCGEDAGVTRAEFENRATAICAEARARRSDLMQKALESVPPAEAEHVPAQEKAQLAGVGPFETATRALEALEAPEEDTEQVEALLRAREQAAVRVREAPATAYFSTYPYREANELSKTLGLGACRV